MPKEFESYVQSLEITRYIAISICLGQVDEYVKYVVLDRSMY